VNRKKKLALNAAGFRIGDAADFLSMTDEERRLLDARVAARRTILRRGAKTSKRKSTGRSR